MTAFWSEASQEHGLVCESDGRVVEGDERSTRAFGDMIGRNISTAVLPGAEDKMRAFIDAAAASEQHGWEIPFVRRGKPCAMLLRGKSIGAGRIAILALCTPETMDRAIGELGAVVNETISLNREIARQKSELAAAYQKLDESHRGVLALHEELADKADTLKRTADVKARVVANVSHEFRTPLHSILGLSKLLLDGVDGDLGDEQRKQVRYIRASAEELSDLVNDMLDLSKTETGRSIIRPTKFSAADFVAAMRGMMRPLVAPGAPVELVFELAEDFELETDQAKISQIVRNLVSNALKFTEQGFVRVSVRKGDDDQLVIAVADTGIGIEAGDQERVFEEFGQVDGPIQERVKGNGLGLSLARKLATLMGGTLTLASTPGTGSTFTLTVPRLHPDQADLLKIQSEPVDPSRQQVLVLDDDRKTIFIYERYLRLAGFQVLAARTVDEARALLQTTTPGAIVLDIMLEGDTTWRFLSDLKKDPATADIPTLVVTVTAQQQKARALGADEFWLKPIDQDRLIRKLRSFEKSAADTRLLVIDDDEKFLYFTRKLLDNTGYAISEATDGNEGIKLAQDLKPDIIFLDFLLREMTAFDVLDELKSDPRTRSIPVIVVTSHELDVAERERLARNTEAIVPKERLSRELAINRIRDALAKAGVGRGRMHE